MNETLIGVDETYIVGVDYSISSPAITILTLTDKQLTNIHTIAYRQTKRQDIIKDKQLTFNNINWNIELIDFTFTNKKYPEQRYFEIANQLLKKLPKEISAIAIENYSYNANGLITDIAECTSVFKQLIYHNYNIPIQLIAPTTAKKHFTGKGNANKQLMYQTLLEHCNIPLHDKFYNVNVNMNKDKYTIPSPLTDIVDSLAIAFTLLSQS